MEERRAKPMPDIAFKVMAFLIALHHRFINVREKLGKTGIKEGRTVLDFGCGPGHYAIAAARIVGENGVVNALDIHPLAIQAVEKKAEKKGLTNITTILSDRDTGLADQSIDVILLYDTIHMLKDKRALLKELHRVMKSNGLLSILVERVKVEDVVQLAEKDGLFSLRDRYGKLLNFERGQHEQAE